MTIDQKLRRFVHAHRRCGSAQGHIEPQVGTGFLVWIDCPCGASFEHWVSAPADDAARSQLAELLTLQE